MADLNVGDKAPDFNLPSDGGGTVKLSDYKGRTLVLYFYPKDDTPGCTKEACDFTANIKAFEKLDSAVVGVSKCSVKKHDKFKEKYKLSFPLASDEDGDVCARYGTWIEKSMYGRKYMGIDRATFLIGKTGKIEAIWRKVSVPGHIDAVMEAVKESNKKAA